jgi:hypothetical protein
MLYAPPARILAVTLVMVVLMVVIVMVARRTAYYLQLHRDGTRGYFEGA